MPPLQKPYLYHLDIEIEYEGKEIILPVQLIKRGYTYRLIIVVNGTEVFFEPDEEGSYRAIIEDSTVHIDPVLLEAIIAELELMNK